MVKEKRNVHVLSGKSGNDVETFYCENCGEEGLTQDETVADSIGGIFCSNKCKNEFHKVMKENRKRKGEFYG